MKIIARQTISLYSTNCTICMQIQSRLSTHFYLVSRLVVGRESQLVVWKMQAASGQCARAFYRKRIKIREEKISFQYQLRAIKIRSN